MKTVEPDSADSLVFECDFDEPPEKVWRALTEPELLEAWLTKDASRERNVSDCEIVSAEPHRRLRYRWRDRETGTADAEPREVNSVVTLELSVGSAGGTHLRLTHGEFKLVTGAVRPIAIAAVRSVRVRQRRRQPVSNGALLSLRRAA
ncbi:MAG: SRPBCC family protein [Acetobacteraceae bacterium]